MEDHRSTSNPRTHAAVHHCTASPPSIDPAWAALLLTLQPLYTPPSLLDFANCMRYTLESLVPLLTCHSLSFGSALLRN